MTRTTGWFEKLHKSPIIDQSSARVYQIFDEVRLLSRYPRPLAEQRSIEQWLRIQEEFNIPSIKDFDVEPTDTQRNAIKNPRGQMLITERIPSRRWHMLEMKDPAGVAFDAFAPWTARFLRLLRMQLDMLISWRATSYYPPDKISLRSRFALSDINLPNRTTTRRCGD